MSYPERLLHALCWLCMCVHMFVGNMPLISRQQRLVIHDHLITWCTAIIRGCASSKWMLLQWNLLIFFLQRTLARLNLWLRWFVSLLKLQPSRRVEETKDGTSLQIQGQCGRAEWFLNWRAFEKFWVPSWWRFLNLHTQKIRKLVWTFLENRCRQKHGWKFNRFAVGQTGRNYFLNHFALRIMGSQN